MTSTNVRPWTTKLPVDPTRIRHMPRQFAPVDRRLVYDGHTCRMTHQQIALYVFLQCVGDAAGLSYYSDERICQCLHFSVSELRDARQGLIQWQFMLYRKPIYQVLDLPQPASSPAAAASSSPCREARRDTDTRDAIPIGSVVRKLCAKGFST